MLLSRKIYKTRNDANGNYDRDAPMQEVAPPVYRFFGEDHEGRGVYRAVKSKGLLASSEKYQHDWRIWRNRHSWIAVKKEWLRYYIEVGMDEVIA